MTTSHTSPDNYGLPLQALATSRQTAALREGIGFGIKADR